MTLRPCLSENGFIGPQRVLDGLGVFENLLYNTYEKEMLQCEISTHY